MLNIEKIEKLFETYNPLPPSSLVEDFDPKVDLRTKKDKSVQPIPVGILLCVTPTDLTKIYDFIVASTRAKIFYVKGYPVFETIYLLSDTELRNIKQKRKEEFERIEKNRQEIEERGLKSQ